MSKEFDFREPHLIHQFPDGELVTDMVLVPHRKHWYSRKKPVLYVTTNKNMYMMETK